MIVLTAVSMLGGVAAPAVTSYVDDARLVRANHDARTLSTSLVRLFHDVRQQRQRPGGWGTYTLLVGPGAVPRAATAASRSWTLPASAAMVGLLDDHLNRNLPGYTPRTSAGFGWRGAYLQERVSSDPWGQRYAVNVGVMARGDMDTVVLSPGPDAIVQSAFARDGLPTEGDDVVIQVAASGFGQ
jgi:hypothetical protein